MPTNWQIGDRIQNRWDIHNIIKGGMGVVYVVYDHELHLPLAAKTFQDEIFSHSPLVAQRFEEEAVTWMRIEPHPNVVEALSVLPIADKPYLFLEYVSGGDLSSLIGNGNLPANLPQALTFAIQFCDGMTHALTQGINAHRDIKAQNCLVTEDGVLKVTDFGLAKVFDEASTNVKFTDSKRLRVNLSRTGTAAGTCTHMAPEQFDDAKRVDVRADIYSFGVMLYQMLTGQLPFVGRSWSEFERLHRTEQAPFLIHKSGELNAIVQRCLAKDSKQRYSNFQNVREALARVYSELIGEDVPQPVVGPALDVARWWNKGVSLSVLRRHEEALDCYDQALKLDPGDERVWSNKGSSLSQLGQREDALACFDRALKINSHYAKAWSNKGSALLELGRYTEALVCIEHALEIDPRYVKALLFKATTLTGLGRREEAFACYDEALEIDPSNAEVWYDKATALAELSRPEEALACYDCALDINPGYAEAWSNRRVTLNELGNYEEALVCFDRALKINQHYADAWYNKGVALEALERYDETFGCYDRVLEINPHDSNAWYSKGVAFNRLGKLAEAVSCYDRALEINARYADAWSNKGAALQELGRYKQALDCFDHALELDPHHVDAWYGKGAALVNGFQRYREALVCFETAQLMGLAQAQQAISWCRRMIRQE